jgi:antitoxin component YwqK of YwqJK toxin-antitoxin module
MSANQHQPDNINQPRNERTVRGWRRRALSGLTLSCVSLLGAAEYALAQQPSNPAPYRPASHAGVPAPLVPLNPPSQKPPAKLSGFLTSPGQELQQPQPGVTPAPGTQASETSPPIPLRRGQNEQSGPIRLDFRDLDQQRDLDQPLERGDRSQKSGKRTIETSGRVEVVKQHYPDGKIQIEREVTQDLEGNYFNHGYWRLYGPAGQTLADGVFQHGLMEGPWSRWHPAQPEGLFRLRPFNLFRGPFLSTVTFIEGKLDGVWTITDSSQRKVMEVAYREGKRHGLSAWYYPDSSRMREQYFNDGVLDGFLTEWDERGKETRRDEYVKGRRIVTETANYRPQQKKSEVTYLDPLLELEGSDDWWEATPAAFKSIGKKVQNGACTTWYENGQPQMQGQYQDGKRVGQWTWWHSNGMKQLAGRFDVDRKTGQWTWWHANGLKSIEGNYQSDRPAGIWNWWDEKGKRTDTRNYEQESGEAGEPEVEPLDFDDGSSKDGSSKDGSPTPRPEQPAEQPPQAAPPKQESTDKPAANPNLKPGESPLPAEEEMEEIPLELPPDPKKDG